ncbi:MAG TPA: MauE/DoxX family redox-associated membrane protein [Caulobacteraceae bacterium]|jgi:hypothetical protein|nr:MauE/DoxX family redox-associated membrane protein [Caulobacteraceae bacterium]
MALSLGLGGEVLRLGLGLVALLAAVHKLVQRSRTQGAAIDLIGLGRHAGAAGWTLALVAELGGAALLLTGREVLAGAALLAGLWLAYAAAVAAAALHGGVRDCGCSFGQRHVPPVFAVARNLLLAGLAGLTAFDGRGEAAPLLFSLPAAIVFLCLYLAADAVGSITLNDRSRA